MTFRQDRWVDMRNFGVDIPERFLSEEGLRMYNVQVTRLFLARSSWRLALTRTCDAM